VQQAVEQLRSTAYNPDHFRGVTKMVRVGSGAEWPVDDFMFTRYACYLIAQNGEPKSKYPSPKGQCLRPIQPLARQSPHPAVFYKA
jgi:hypothetical protein